MLQLGDTRKVRTTDIISKTIFSVFRTYLVNIHFQKQKK